MGGLVCLGKGLGEHKRQAQVYLGNTQQNDLWRCLG